MRRESWLGGELGLLLLVGCPVWGAFASTVRNTAACVLQEYLVVFICLAVIGQVSAFWSFFYDWEFFFFQASCLFVASESSCSWPTVHIVRSRAVKLFLLSPIVP